MFSKPRRSERSMSAVLRREITSVSLCLGVAVLAACETRDPVTLLDGCIAQASASARAGTGVVDIRCDLGRDVVVAAIPKHEVGAEELHRAGVPEGALAGLTAGQSAGPRWCIIDEPNDVPDGLPRDGEERRGFSVTCSSSRVVIPDLSIIKSRVIDISLVRTDNGLMLRGFRSSL